MMDQAIVGIWPAVYVIIDIFSRRIVGWCIADRVGLVGEIARFRAVCSDQLWRAMVLATETGQRQGNLLTLAWLA